MMEQFINLVIRPPRADYEPEQYLWEKQFSLGERKYRRVDLELKNERGHTLQCSHYVPSPFPAATRLPCVIYCHGNSGCRADANDAALILLHSNITLFTLDFSGSGLSGGDYVTLGSHEKNDLKVVVSHLRASLTVSRIGLWGRSMGAVTSLLYGAQDPSIAGMVVDSAFSSLFHLMMELVHVYKIRLPKFTIKVALRYMRRVIRKRAGFDIMTLNCLQVAPGTFIPALFGHAKDDKFIQPHHSDDIFKAYAGDKNIIKFDGDHNSSRPQFFYDSVSIFFYNVLQPPKLPATCKSTIEKYYDLADLKVSANADENLLYKIIAGLQSVNTDAASSSSAPPDISAPKSVGELLSELAPVAGVLESVVIEECATNCDDSSSQLQGKSSGLNEESCSFTSSNRESWGRCSSLGSDDEPCSNGAQVSKDQATTLDVLATPVQDGKIAEEGSTIKKSKREKFENISQRLRLCILKSVKQRRHSS